MFSSGVLMVIDFKIGDPVTLKKKHPCGGSTWSIDRVGADIGLVCSTCSRRVILSRLLVEKNMK